MESSLLYKNIIWFTKTTFTHKNDFCSTRIIFSLQEYHLAYKNIIQISRIAFCLK